MTITVTEKIQQANIAAIYKKVRSGKVLNAREQEIVEEHERQKAAPVAGNRWLCTVIELSDLLGVSTMSLTNYGRLGLPKLGRNQYDAKVAVRWWAENVAQPKNASAPAKADHERFMCARADNEELKRDRLKEKLISKDRAIAEFVERAADLKTSLRALKHRLAPVLEGKSRDEIAEKLSTEIDDMLRGFVRAGRYIFPPAPVTKKRVKKATPKRRGKN